MSVCCRELAETQLQCAVCSELFVEAVSVNCGHTFCTHCIAEWRKKKNNCPVCRTDIRASAPCKVSK
jgi:E3 ubiquitin-protein ligase RNF8